MVDLQVIAFNLELALLRQHFDIYTKFSTPYLPCLLLMAMTYFLILCLDLDTFDQDACNSFRNLEYWEHLTIDNNNVINIQFLFYL